MGLSGPEQPTRVSRQVQESHSDQTRGQVAGEGAGAGLAQSSFLRFHLSSTLRAGLSSLEPGDFPCPGLLVTLPSSSALTEAQKDEMTPRDP